MEESKKPDYNRPMAALQTVGVCGAGTMGAGIAQAFAQSGFPVTLYDVAQAQLGKAKAGIESSLKKFAEKGKFPAAEVPAALSRVKTATALDPLAACALVVEAAPEMFEIKADLFRKLDALAGSDAILATNTSSISITRLGAVTKRPERVIGMHFMNPVPLMPLVEVIRGHLTSDATTATTMELAKKLGKTPVEVHDAPGFVANRILMPMINEAVFALQEGVGTKESIDTVMKLGMNHPMGPLTLADFIGLDVCLAILEVLESEYKDPKYRPCILLRNMVRAGLLGRKTGRGFYEYLAK